MKTSAHVCTQPVCHADTIYYLSEEKKLLMSEKEQEQFISWTTLLPSHDGNLLLSTRESIVLGYTESAYDCTQICFLLSTTSFVHPWLLLKKSSCCPKMKLHMDTSRFRFSSGRSEGQEMRGALHTHQWQLSSEPHYGTVQPLQWNEVVDVIIAGRNLHLAA